MGIVPSGKSSARRKPGEVDSNVRFNRLVAEQVAIVEVFSYPSSS
jgi:hypothetical protein